MSTDPTPGGKKTVDDRDNAWVQTYTGRAVHLLNTRPDDIHPADIGHALGMLCRYNGHTHHFYSVAEHCVLMSRAVPPQHALWALLHDATEAYVGDMVRPLKQVMPDFEAVEDRLMSVIAARFGLDPVMPDAVRDADRRILVDERARMMGTCEREWKYLRGVPPLGVRPAGWMPEQASSEWLTRLADLWKDGDA